MKQAETILSRAGRAGFTLVELLLVITILGVLAAVAVSSVGGVSTEARVNATRTSISAIEQAVKMYEIRVGQYPDQFDQLFQKIGAAEAPLEEKARNDSWGNPFQYRRDGSSFEIRSAGPDGQMNTDDDITNK